MFGIVDGRITVRIILRMGGRRMVDRRTERITQVRILLAPRAVLVLRALWDLRWLL